MITKEIAQTTHRFYHIAARRSRGNAVEARVNGKCKTWKTRPLEYRLPVKVGFKTCLYITHENAADWLTFDRWQVCKDLKLDETTPLGVVMDLMKEKGLLS